MTSKRTLFGSLAAAILLALPVGVIVTSCADDLGDGACATVECGALQYCDAGSCVQVDYPIYTANNACDPLRICRRQCGTDARCAESCEADRSPQCVNLASTLASCERRNSCDSGPYVQTCCFQEFCATFPSHPNCGNVPPCRECVDQCGDNNACLSNCVRGEPACAECLDDARACVAGGGTQDACEAPCVRE